MFDNIKEKTAPNTSVGADVGQLNHKNNTIIIPELDENFNDFEKDFEEMQREMFLQMNPSYLKTISMTELFSTVYRTKQPIIDGLLNAGTYIFAGAPKLGKSFFMAQLAYHISTGTPLWNYKIKKSTVLYLALEDDYNRLQSRLYRMFGATSNENLHFSVSAGQLGQGLDEQLTGFMERNPDTKLIIIDTLQKIREADGDKLSYANDYKLIARLKKFTDNYGICLLLVHHTRKQSADDKFDMISGTNGLLGASDGAFLLQKEKRTGNSAVLEISGRDQQDQKLYLKRNTETLLWELEKAEIELWNEPIEPLIEDVLNLFKEDFTSWEGSPTELVELLNLEIKPNILTYKLNVNASKLLQKFNIMYENKRTHNGRKIKLELQRDDA
ncbi:MAG: helicase RepA family protein [Clostridia bacterium]